AFSQKSSLDRIGTETCRRHVMFIEGARRSRFFRKERNAGISLFTSMVRSEVAINISPLCGDLSFLPIGSLVAERDQSLVERFDVRILAAHGNFAAILFIDLVNSSVSG